MNLDENPSLRDPRIRAKFEKMTKEEQEEWLKRGSDKSARRMKRAQKRMEAAQKAKAQMRKGRSASVPKTDGSGKFARRNAMVQVDLGDVEKEFAKKEESHMEKVEPVKDVQLKKEDVEDVKVIETEKTKETDGNEKSGEQQKRNTTQRREQQKNSKKPRSNPWEWTAPDADEEPTTKDLPGNSETEKQNSTKEEPKREEPKKEEPKQKELRKEEPKKEEMKKETPKKEEPKKEEPKKEETKKEEPKKEETKKEEPKKEEAKKEDTVTGDDGQDKNVDQPKPKPVAKSGWGSLKIDATSGPIEIMPTILSTHPHKPKASEHVEEPNTGKKRWRDGRSDKPTFKKQRPNPPSEREPQRGNKKEWVSWEAPSDDNPFIYQAPAKQSKPKQSESTPSEPTKAPKYDCKDPRVAYYVRGPTDKREKHKHRRPRVVIPENALLSDEQAMKVVELGRLRRDIVLPEYPDKWMLDTRVEFYETAIEELEAEIREIWDRIEQGKGKQKQLEELESHQAFKKRQVSKRIGHVCRRIENVSATIEDIDNEMTALRRQHERMAKTYDVHSVSWRKERIARMTMEIETASLSNYELKQRLAKVNKMITENETKFADMEENELEQESLRTRKKEFTEELVRLRKDRVALFKQRDALEKDIETAGAETGAVSDDIAQLNKIVEEKKAMIADKKRIVSALIALYFRNLDEWNEKTARLDEIDAEMQKIVDSLPSK